MSVPLARGRNAVSAESGSLAWEHALAANLLDDPYALTADVLNSCPPVFSHASPQNERRGEGIWVATRIDAIREILQDNDRYSSQGTYPYFRMTGDDLRAIPAQLDPPEHDTYRKFPEPWFTPKAVMQLKPRILATVHQLIDGFVDKGECDAAYDFSRIGWDRRCEGRRKNLRP